MGCVCCFYLARTKWGLLRTMNSPQAGFRQLGDPDDGPPNREPEWRAIREAWQNRVFAKPRLHGGRKPPCNVLVWEGEGVNKGSRFWRIHRRRKREIASQGHAKTAILPIWLGTSPAFSADGGPRIGSKTHAPKRPENVLGSVWGFSGPGSRFAGLGPLCQPTKTATFFRPRPKTLVNLPQNHPKRGPRRDRLYKIALQPPDKTC